MFRFTILRSLGEGAMGRVVLARDAERGRDVALKFLSSSEEHAALFRREVELLSRLSHPNLIAIHDYFPSSAGLMASPPGPGPFFSMDVADGRPLDDAFGALPAQEILDAFVQILRGLHDLHARGVLHRDLKPANLHYDDAGRVKILDYGVAGVLGFHDGLIAGTSGYLPPEALKGDYGPESDLYSLGRVFRGLLGDARADLPKPFMNLLERMTRRDPRERPASAAGALRYLREHGLTTATLGGADGPALLTKTPWIPRAEEAVLQRAMETKGDFRLVRVTGPTGVGRTRLLRELRLRWQLEGLAEGADFFLFEDLHSWHAERLRDLHVRLQEEKRRRVPALFVLEDDADRTPPELARLLANLADDLRTVALGDFTPAQSRSFLEKASADFDPPPSPDDVRRIAEAAGGRALLLVEGLRRRGAATDAGALPRTLEDACRRKVADLPDAARTVLAVLLAALEAPEAAPWDEAAAACRRLGVADPESSLWELRRRDVVRSEETRGWAWTHPSLTVAYAQAIPAGTFRDVHAAWSQSLPPEASAVRVVHHALGRGDAAGLALARERRMPALDALFAAGRLDALLDMTTRLLDAAASDEDRYVAHAYRANALYRLGRYDESLRAYDDWATVRPDDGTGLIPLRHRLHRGQVLLVAGRPREARAELNAALAAGDSRKHAHHRVYHAQARLLLATLDEREGHRKKAAEELAQARALAEGQDGAREIAGEIEYRDGLLRQSTLDFDGAETRFGRALELCRASGNPQIEATLVNALALLERARGDLAKAETFSRDAVALAEAGGERVQIASLRRNAALLAMDRGRYRAAKALMEDSDAVFEALGSPEEKAFAALHRLNAVTPARNRDLVEAAVADARRRLDGFAHPFLEAHFALAEAEARYVLGEYETALGLFTAAGRAFEAMEDGAGAAEAALGRWRSGARRGDPEPPAFDGKTPAMKTWRRIADFMAGGDLPLPALWDEVLKLPSPTAREDALRTLGTALARRGFERLSGAFETSANKEKISIFKNLPEEYQLAMDTNKDLSQFEKTLVEMGGAATAGKRQISESRFRQFCAVSRQIVQKRHPLEVLERMMDAALEMTGAERGFVLVKSSPKADGTDDSPIAGYEVKSARHMNQRALHEKEFQLSLSTVRDVIAKGVPTLTNDAQLDPRFQDKKSVALQGLKSILVVPLEREGEVIGVLYLDHRYQSDCFSDEDVTVLTAFASFSSLALENARMMEELAAAKRGLEGRVEDQNAKIQILETEIEKRRTELKFGYEEIIGQSKPMMKVFRNLDHISETNVPVWIFGESGTGKELIAKSLHVNSPRKDGPFVAENVSAISETLLESELFGHKKGAFTHADRDRSGLFEQADGGTLFLDEIADMSPAMQVKLLRVLQEGEVRPVGSGKKVKIDVRLVTASNKDLRKLVKAGKFREDLFYRINGMMISLPALRDRKDDIPLLIAHLIERASKSLNIPASEVDNEAMDLLLRHDWPGNVRELEATLRNALVFARGKTITAAHLKSNEELMASMKRKVTIPEAHEESKQIENKAEKELLVDTLKLHKMDKKAAAGEMGVSLKTLYARMAVHNIPKKKTVLAGFLGLRD